VRVCAFIGEAKTLTLTLSHAADGAGEGKQLRGPERLELRRPSGTADQWTVAKRSPGGGGGSGAA
jgi:hypothetical protein